MFHVESNLYDINWARSWKLEWKPKKNLHTMEMSVLSSPGEEDLPLSDSRSKECFPLKRQRPILKSSDSSTSWDAQEAAKLVQFRVAGSESDVDGQTAPNEALDVATTEKNGYIVRTRYVHAANAHSTPGSFPKIKFTVNESELPRMAKCLDYLCSAVPVGITFVYMY